MKFKTNLSENGDKFLKQFTDKSESSDYKQKRNLSLLKKAVFCVIFSLFLPRMFVLPKTPSS